MMSRMSRLSMGGTSFHPIRVPQGRGHWQGGFYQAFSGSTLSAMIWSWVLRPKSFFISRRKP